MCPKHTCPFAYNLLTDKMHLKGIILASIPDLEPGKAAAQASPFCTCAVSASDQQVTAELDAVTLASKNLWLQQQKQTFFPYRCQDPSSGSAPPPCFPSHRVYGGGQKREFQKTATLTTDTDFVCDT